MKLTLEINNIAKSPIRDVFFNSIARKTLKNSAFNFLNPPAGGKNISISVALVDAKEIKKINKIYRHKNETTDILSFAEYKSPKEMKAVVDKELFLGELVLCYDYIKKYAEKRETKLDQELANAVSHGILHLLGFRHGKKMFQIQDKITNNQ